MNKCMRIVFSLFLCVAFVVALGGTVSTKAAPSVPPQPQEVISKGGEVITVKATDSNVASLAPITPARMRTAKPVDLVALKPADLRGMPEDYSAGAPGSKPGGMADPEVLAKVKAENADAWNRPAPSLPALQAPSLDTFGTKNTWSGYLGNYFNQFWTDFPYSAVGRLYFTDGYYDYTCTASLIARYTIVTAAHCVYNTDYNYWYYGWVFVPADYNFGANMPFGYFDYYSATILTKYVSAKSSSKGLSTDVAIITLYGDPGGAAGWFGYTWNWGTKQLHHAIGYPSNIFSGISTYICVAESFSGKGGLGMGCDMTYGSSGGPWVLWFTPYMYYYPISWGGNYVNSVVSGGVVGTPTFYGPKFTTSTIYTLCYATGWC
jgi:Trypsin